MRLRKRKWMDPLLEERSELILNADNLATVLDELKDKKKILEIGSGKGGFLSKMAMNNPEYEFIGVEMQTTALAIACKYIEKNSINNLRFFASDVALLFEKFEEESFDYIFLNFSDPWPKKRHHKRRLTFPTFLSQYHRLLKKGGRLIFKTDNVLLFDDSLEYLNESEFKMISYTRDYDGLDEFDAQTEYETKFRGLGTPINRVIVEKE